MSTEYGFTCRSHTPHLHSHALFAKPEPLRWIYQHRHDLIAWFNLAGTRGSVVEYPTLEGCLQGGSMDPLVFLRDHLYCSLGIYADDGNPLGPTIEPLSDGIGKAS